MACPTSPFPCLPPAQGPLHSLPGGGPEPLPHHAGGGRLAAHGGGGQRGAAVRMGVEQGGRRSGTRQRAAQGAAQATCQRVSWPADQPAEASFQHYCLPAPHVHKRTQSCLSGSLFSSPYDAHASCTLITFTQLHLPLSLIQRPSFLPPPPFCPNAVWPAGPGRHGGPLPAHARGLPCRRRGARDAAGVRLAAHAGGGRQRRGVQLGAGRQRAAGARRGAGPVSEGEGRGGQGGLCMEGSMHVGWEESADRMTVRLGHGVERACDYGRGADGRVLGGEGGCGVYGVGGVGCVGVR